MSPSCLWRGLLAGLLSLFGALSYAELGAAIPEAGGEYAYLRRGFGPVWGYLFGWMHSIVGRPSSAASIAAGMMRFLAFFLPAVAAPIFTVHLGDSGAYAMDPALRFRFHVGTTAGGVLAGGDDGRELPGGAARRRSAGISDCDQGGERC